MKLSEIEATTSRVEDGAWMRSIPNLPGLALKVRGIDCTAAELRRKQLLLELSDEDRRKLSDANSERITTELMAGVLLTGWNITKDGPLGADGVPTQVPIPFTVEAARAALTNPKTLLLREGVAYASRMVALLGVASLETDAKN